MLPLYIPVLDATTTKPSDLLAALHARAGHAFVPITQAPFVWSTNRARRDEVVFTNYASNRWSLKLPKRGGYAGALTVPIDGLFDRSLGRLTFPAKPLPAPRTVPPWAWNSRSGVLASVAEILRAGRISAERCHEAYRRRTLIVRFDPNSLEAGLPDLAGAVGGIWNARTGTIDFDPRAFREHIRASLPERLVEASGKDDLKLAITRMGILHASDSELTALFDKDRGGVRFGIERLTARERGAVARYAAMSLERIERDGGSTTYRKRFEPGATYYIHVSAGGYGGAGLSVPSDRGGVELFEF